MSVYGQQFRDEPNPDITSLVDWPYQELSRSRSEQAGHDCGVGDWRISVRAGEPGLHKPEWIKQGLELFRTRYPRVKAAVYWHERWQNLDQSYSNLRVNSSVESLEAYRNGIGNPDWLGNLILRALPKR